MTLDGPPASSGSGKSDRERWTSTWHHLTDEVIDSGLCTGCSGCIIACPRNVLTLDTATWKPELAPQAHVDGDPGSCVYSARGCTMCTRACPRFGLWETDADMDAWGRTRRVEEILGVHQGILLVKASDPEIAANGQDGGLGTALLAFALERDLIDAALVSYVGEGQTTYPGIARTREELIQAAGSRYTYSSNLLAFADAIATDGVDRLGLVSVGCQVSIPPVASRRGVRRVARRFALNIGLLCSKTFDESIYSDLLDDGYGIARSDIKKVNIKGKLQVWTDSPPAEPPDLEISLKECHPYQRAGCNHCPDFAAEHADLSLGGIGKKLRTTLTIVRSDLGADLIDQMQREGLITVEDAVEDDPAAVALITRMAKSQRKRWAASSGAARNPHPAAIPVES